jgi:ParB family chromosome partitioning protein
MKIKRIEISDIRENGWNPNRMDERKFRALVKSISERGFVQPLVVRPAEHGAFEVLDGAHRLRALFELGEKHADCVVLDEKEADAKMRTLSMNRLRGECDYEALAGVLGTLGLDDAAISAALAFSERDLSEIRALLEKTPSVDFNLPAEERYVLMDFYLAPEDAEIVEKALKSTGKKNRSKALVALVRRAAK